jgi:hypothetical protein
VNGKELSIAWKTVEIVSFGIGENSRLKRIENRLILVSVLKLTIYHPITCDVSLARRVLKIVKYNCWEEAIMISLGNGWCMKPRQDQIIVYKRNVNKKTGKEYHTLKYFYNTYEDALNGLLNRSIQNLRTDNLETICNEIRKASKRIIQQLPEELKRKEMF